MHYVRASDNEQPFETNIHLCKGLFVKHAVFAMGTLIPQHVHEYEHLTVVATGAVRVWTGDGDGPAETLLGDFYAPSGIVIKANQKHLFLSLQPLTAVLCIHRVGEDGLPEITAEHHILQE